MTKTKLLVITNDNHMTEPQRTTFTACVQAIAGRVGAELLVLLPGQHAQLLGMREAPSTEPLNATEGVALSFQLDPLESAISQTVQVLGDEMVRMSEAGATSTTAYQRLGQHLDALLVEQLKRVTTIELPFAAS